MNTLIIDFVVNLIHLRVLTVSCKTKNPVA